MNSSVNGTLSSYCRNMFSKRIILSTQESLAIAVTSGLLIPFTVLTNFNVIRFLVQSKQLWKISSYLIFILSLADICTGLIVLPLKVVLFTVYHRVRFCKFELFAQFASHLILRTSIQILAVIALDRMINLKKMTKYDSVMTKRKVNFSITAVLCVSVITATASCISSLMNQYFFTNLVLHTADMTLICTILFYYANIYYSVWSFVKHSILWKGRNLDTQKKKPEYLSKLGNTIFLMLLSIFLCYVPFIIMAFYVIVKIFAYEEKISRSEGFALFFSYPLICANSSVNAVIFLWRNDIFGCITLNRKRMKSALYETGSPEPNRNNKDLHVAVKDQTSY